MLTHRWSFAGRRRQLLVPLFGVVLLVVLLTTGARASQPMSDPPVAAPEGAWPAVARPTAGTMAQRWAANVRASARLGAEPAGACHRLDDRHAACPIGIVALVRDAAGQRPWRCTAQVLVSRSAGVIVGHRADTHCARFPAPSAAPDASALLGSAFALNANGDIACLPANGGRTTCVMSYAVPLGQHCMAAASVPLGRPGRAIALADPVCRAGRHR